MQLRFAIRALRIYQDKTKFTIPTAMLPSLSVDTIDDAIRKGLDIADTMKDGVRRPYGDKIQDISWEAYGSWYEIQ